MTDIRSELQKILDTHGYLNPRITVDEAADEDHPLHASLEWDNEVAGDAYRLTQAHRLITSCKITYARGEKMEKVRAFHAVRGTEGAYSYEPAAKVAADPILREIVLRDMEREWRQLHSRYGKFAEFVELVTTELEEAG